MAARELTRDEKKKIRSLVTGMCANYDGESGLCLPLDCPCYMLHKCWTGAYCRYFKNAVLPVNPELEASLTKEGTAPELRFCAVCEKAFLPEGRQSYCSEACKAEGNRRKSRERMRKCGGKSRAAVTICLPGGLDITGFLRRTAGVWVLEYARPRSAPLFRNMRTLRANVARSRKGGF